MIQRIQTLYMILAVALAIACICMPLAQLTMGGLEVGVIFNACTVAGHDCYMGVCPLLLILLSTVGLGGYAVMKYNDRTRQQRLLTLNILLLALWYVFFVVSGLFFHGFIDVPTAQNALSEGAEVEFVPQTAIVLPAVAIILYLMAWKAIQKDKNFLRRMESIR